jgi:hypothetical protein
MGKLVLTAVGLATPAQVSLVQQTPIVLVSAGLALVTPVSFRKTVLMG